MFGNFFRNTPQPDSSGTRTAAATTVPLMTPPSIHTSSHQGQGFTETDMKSCQFLAADNLANLALAGGMNRYSQRKVSPEDFVLLKVIGKGSYGELSIWPFVLSLSQVKS